MWCMFTDVFLKPPLTAKIILKIFGSPDLTVFPQDLLSARDSVYTRENSFEILGTPLKTCLICTGGPPWKFVWNFGSRNYLKSDLLRLWYLEMHLNTSWDAFKYIVSTHTNIQKKNIVRCVFKNISWHVFKYIFTHLDKSQHARLFVSTHKYFSTHTYVYARKNFNTHMNSSKCIRYTPGCASIHLNSHQHLYICTLLVYTFVTQQDLLMCLCVCVCVCVCVSVCLCVCVCGHAEVSQELVPPPHTRACSRHIMYIYTCVCVCVCVCVRVCVGTHTQDLLVDKATYPKLLGMEASKKRADDLITEAKAQLEPWGEKVHTYIHTHINTCMHTYMNQQTNEKNIF